MKIEELTNNANAFVDSYTEGEKKNNYFSRMSVNGLNLMTINTTEK